MVYVLRILVSPFVAYLSSADLPSKNGLPAEGSKVEGFGNQKEPQVATAVFGEPPLLVG